MIDKRVNQTVQVHRLSAALSEHHPAERLRRFAAQKSQDEGEDKKGCPGGHSNQHHISTKRVRFRVRDWRSSGRQALGF